MRNQRGITLVEILILVGILGILTGVVVPNVLGLFHRTKHYHTEEGTYRVINYTGDCTEGNWTFEGTEYHWFCPK